jgi:hypothetical protein
MFEECTPEAWGAKKVQKGYKGNRVTYTAIPIIPRHSMIEYQKMRLSTKSVKFKGKTGEMRT